MLAGFAGRRKPPRGRPIDRMHPLARGLVACVPCWEGGIVGFAAPPAYDLVTGAALRPYNTFSTWTAGPTGLALACVQGGAGFSSSAPALALRWPISLAIGFQSVANRSSAMLGGLGCSTTWGPSFAALGFNFPSASANAMSLNYTTGATNATINVAGAPATNGVDLVWSTSFASGQQAAYAQGTPVYSGSAALADPQIILPTLWVGAFPGQGAAPNVLVYWMMLWNRMLSPPEHAALARDPWRLLLGYSTIAWFTQAGVAVYAVLGSPVVR